MTCSLLFLYLTARSGVCSGFVRSIMVLRGAKQEHLCTKLSRQSLGERTKRTNVPVQRTFSEIFVKQLVESRMTAGFSALVLSPDFCYNGSI